MQEFEIRSMTCGGCVARVVQAVRSLDATAKVEVDVASRVVRVDSSETRASLNAALAKAGYPPAADSLAAISPPAGNSR